MIRFMIICTAHENAEVIVADALPREQVLTKIATLDGEDFAIADDNLYCNYRVYTPDEHNFKIVQLD